MATSMAAATIGHVKLLRPLRERDFALRAGCVALLGDAGADAGAGASAAESGSATPAIS